MSSDDEDRITNSLLWQLHELNYGTVEVSSRWSDGSSEEERLATPSVHSDGEHDAAVGLEQGRSRTVVWLAVLMGLWVVIGAVVMVLVLL